MNNKQAQQVLSMLVHYQDVNRSWAAQMPEIADQLVPSFRGDNLYKSNSFLGHVIKWVRGYKTKKGHLKAVEKVFWDAITTCPADAKIAITQERKILLTEYLGNKYTKTGQEVRDHSFHKELKNEAKENSEDAEAVLKRKSLLHPIRFNESRKQPPKATIDELFDFVPRTDIFYKYIQDETKIDITPKKRDLVKAATDREDRLQRTFFTAGVRLAETERRALYEKETKALKDSVHNLKEGETILWIGSYGQKIRTIRDIFEMSEKLPTYLKTFIPPNVIELFATGASADPEEFVQAHVLHILNGMKGVIPHFNTENLSFLFSNDKRTLPEGIKAQLPEILGDTLQKGIKKGLFGTITAAEEIYPSPEVNEVLSFIFQVMKDQRLEHPGLVFLLNLLSGCVPGKELLPILKSVQENLGDFFDAEKKDLAEIKLQEAIFTTIKGPLRVILDPVTAHFEKLRNLVKKLVPALVVRGTTMESLFVQGSVWFEFEKEKDNKYTVKVYGDEYASSVFSQFGKRDCWPIVIKNVKEEDLKEDFFHTILLHHFEPSSSSKFRSTAEALYMAVETLNGVWPRNRARNADLLSNRTISEAYFLEDEATLLALFNAKIDAFIDLAHSSMKDGEIQVQNEPEKKELLFKTAAAIAEELQKFPKITDKRREAIQATVEEVRMCCLIPMPSEEGMDPEMLAAPVAEIFKKCGITKEILCGYGDVFKLALGPEMMEVIEVIMDTLDVQEIAVAKKPENVPSIPTDEKITRLQAIIRNMYFQMVFKFVRNAYLSYCAISSPIYLIYLMMPYATDFIPEQYLTFIKDMISKIGQILARIFTYALVRLIFTVKAGAALQLSQKQLGNYLKAKMKEPALSYTLGTITSPTDLVIQFEEEATHFPREISRTVQDRRGYQADYGEKKQDLTLLGSLKATVDKYCKPDIFEESFFKVVEYEPTLEDNESRMWLMETLLLARFADRVDVTMGSKENNELWETAARLLSNPAFALHITKLILSNRKFLIDDLKESSLIVTKYDIAIPSRDITIRLNAGTVLGVNNDYKVNKIQLIDRVYALPLPHEAESPWQAVDKPEEYLELLAQMGKELRYRYRDKDEGFKIRLASYHLLAIMETLALRCPNTCMKGFRVNTAVLRLWQRSSVCTLSDPEDVDEFERLLSYSAYSTEEISETELFHYAYTQDYYTENSISPAELNYYKLLYASDPGMDEKISQILEKFPAKKIINDDGNVQIARAKWKECSPSNSQIISVLAAMSRTVEDTDTVVPRPFRLLKHQAAICNMNIIEWYYNGKMKRGVRDFRWWSNSHGIFQIPLRLIERTAHVFDGVNRTSLKPEPWNSTKPSVSIDGDRIKEAPVEDLFVDEKEGKIARIRGKVSQYMHSVKGRFFVGFQGLRHSDLNQSIDRNTLTQSEIILNDNDKNMPLWVKLYFKSDERNTGKLVYAEYTDRIPRLIAYFFQDLNRLFTSAREQEDTAEHLFKVLFQGGFLKIHLKNAPGFARVLGNFITKVLEKKLVETIEQSYIKLGIQLKRYCMKYAPNDCGTFPDFSKHLAFYGGSILERQILVAMEAPKPEPGMTEEGLKKYCIAYCLGRFGSFQSEFHASFKHWVPTIEQFLQDKAFARDIALQLLNVLNILVDVEALDSISVDGLCMTIPKLVAVDFGTGRLVYSKQKELEAVPHLAALDKQTRETFAIRTHGVTQEVERVVDGVTYVAVNWERCRASFAFRREIEAELHKSSQLSPSQRAAAVHSDSYLWIEKTESPEKKLLLFRSTTEYWPIAWKLLKQSNGSYTVQPRSNLQISDERKKGFDIQKLQPLTRFCSISDISISTNKDDKHISRIDIESYRLHFIIEKVGDDHLAFNEKAFPEFYLHPQQDHLSFRQYGSYLLLRNLQGKFKVLISTQNPLTPALWSVYKYVHPFTHMLPSRIATGESRTAHYYAFDADEQGNLQSDDPEALIYLLRMFLMHQNVKSIETTLTQFLTVAKRIPVPLKLWEQMTLLTLVPDLVEKSRKVRVCLFAAMEENLLLHHTNISEKIDDTLSLFQRLLLIQALISDLEYLRSMNNLERRVHGNSTYSLDKEWYLYKCLLRQFDIVLEMRSAIRLFKSREHLDAFIELSVLPVALSARYAQLKEHFELPETLFLKVLRALKFTYKHAAINANNSINLNLHQLVYGVFNKYFSSSAHLLDEVLGSLTSYFNIEQELIHISQRVQQKKIHATTLMRMKELHQEKFDENDDTLFDARKITQTLIQKRFLYYYAVARSERSPDKTPALYRMLSLIHNTFDDETSILIAILRHQFRYGGVCPTTATLTSQMQTPALFPRLNSKLKEIFWKEKNLHVKGVTYAHCLTKEEFYGKFLEIYGYAKESPEKYALFKPRLVELAKADDLSDILYKFLQAVAENPKPYLSVKEFQDLLYQNIDLNLHGYMYKTYIDGWAKLQRDFKMVDVGASGLRIAASGIVHSAINAGILMVRQMITPDLLGSMTLQAGDAVSSTVTALVNASHTTPLLPVKTELYKVDDTPYQELDLDDHFVDSLLERLFKQMFEANLGINSDEKAFAKVDPVHATTPLEEVRIARTNINIDQHYAHDQKRVTYKLLHPEQLWVVYRELIDTIFQIEAELKHDEKALFEIVNYQKKAKIIKFDTLVQFALTGDIELFGDALRLQPDSLRKLDFLIVRQLARGVRLNQLRRVRKLIEKAAKNDVTLKNFDYYTDMEAVADELNNRRAYTFTTLKSPRLILRLLCFEYYSNKLIWPKQYERLTKLLLEKRGNQVVEWIMGLGKTACGIPIIDDMEADGTKIVINIWPRGMVETNVRQIGQQHATVMQRATNVLRFDRDHSTSIHNLHAIKVLLLSCMHNRESLNMTREDIQALELSLIENLYNYEHKHYKDVAEIRRVISDLQEILRLIREHGRAVGDEAHELYNHAQELNYPVGVSKSIQKDLYEKMELCISYLIEVKAVMDAIQTGAKFEVTLGLKKQIAARFNEDKAFIDFVTGQIDHVPDSLSRQADFESISMVKGMLTVLIPNAVSKDSLVDHGPSQQGNGEFSRPYEGNTRAMENSLLRSPYEALTKTFFQFLHSGLNVGQVSDCVKLIRTFAKAEAKAAKIELNKTNMYRLFLKVFPKLDYESTFFYDDFFEEVKFNKDLILFYVKNVVSLQIKYWNLNICSNTQNFGSIFSNQHHLTGTPYNDGTYPDGVSMMWDEGTVGEAIHIASNKCPKDGVRLLQQAKPTLILDEVLNKYFAAADTNFTAIIDGSAVLQGMNDRDVALKILQFVKEHRKHIQGVVFFAKDKFDRDQLMCWVVDAPDPVLLDRTNIPPEARITYYDHLHGFAADVSQKPNGKAVDLVGERVTLFRLLQEIFRMRGIKLWKKLVEDQGVDLTEFKKQTQEVHFALSKDLIAKMGVSAVPTFSDIVTYAIRNESQVGMDNFAAHRNKIENEARRFVLDKILKATSVTAMYYTYLDHKKFLITTIEDRPSRLWGMASKDEDTDVVLGEIENQVVSKFRRKERAELADRISKLKKAPMPKTVQIYTNGKIRRYDSDLDIGQTVTVTTTQNQNQNQQVEVEQSLTVAVLANNKKVSKYVELDWNRASPDWMKFCDPRTDKPTTTVPIWKLSDLLAVSPISESKAVFDTRIWFSNNFLPVKNPNNSLPAYAGSLEQRELIHLLVKGEICPLKNTFKISSVGCLSVKDAAFWRNNMSVADGQSMFIYDVPLVAITWGEDKVTSEMLKKDEDFQRILAQLKLLNAETMVYTDEERKAFRSWLNAGNRKQISQVAAFVLDERKQAGLVKNSVLDQLLAEGQVDIVKRNQAIKIT